MEHIETLYILEIKDIVSYIATELPSVANEYNYTQLLDRWQDAIIGNGLTKAIYQLTGENYVDNAYRLDLNHIADPCLNELQWWVDHQIYYMLINHQLSFSRVVRVKYMTTQNTLMLVVIRKSGV